MSLAVPVAIIIFNRPKETRQLLKTLRSVKPRTVMIIADGARVEGAHAGEHERVLETRRVCEQEIDWACQVDMNYSTKNLGCKRRVVSGLDWVFSRHDRAIILEDDCIPSISFFRFTEELLTYFDGNPRVSSISGSNPFNCQLNSSDSYFMTKYSRIWGWATWASAWACNDPNMQTWPKYKNSDLLQKYFRNNAEVRYWSSIFDEVYCGRIDTWDYQWFYSNILLGKKVATSVRNLVTNIGFGENATHTRNKRSQKACFPRMEVDFPIKHPVDNRVAEIFDAYQQRQILSSSSKATILNRILKAFRNA